MSRKASERYHNRVARQYDSIYNDPYWAFHDELTWQHVKKFLPTDATSHCADLGCGTGKWGLKLLKSGFATTFLDHAPAMIGQVREKVELMGTRAHKAVTVVGDIVNMPDLSDETFALVLAMGDPLSICRDPTQAVREMRRITRTGGVIIATADNQLAAMEHYVGRGDLDGLEEFARTGRTRWLTPDEREQFELTTFTPRTLRTLFEQSGLEVIEIIGKSILPVRKNRALLELPGAIDRLLKIERRLAKDPAAVACAGHLQIAARRV